MVYLILTLFFSSLCAQEVKLSLFLFDDIEKTSNYEKMMEKAEHPIKIYQGEFLKDPQGKVTKLEQMKVDLALYAEEFLDKHLDTKGLHLLTSNLVTSEGKALDTSWRFSLDDIQIGFFGLNQLTCSPGSSSFCCVDLFFSARQKVNELKKNGVDFIVLLCSLPENEIISLIKKVDGINVIISAKKNESLPFFEKDTLIYFQNDFTRLDLLIEKKPMAQGTKVEFYPTWRVIK